MPEQSPVISLKTLYRIRYLLAHPKSMSSLLSPLALVKFVFGVFVLPLHIIVLPSSAILRSEIMERELGSNDAQRRCAENVE